MQQHDTKEAIAEIELVRPPFYPQWLKNTPA
jgi:hypothetical protein